MNNITVMTDEEPSEQIGYIQSVADFTLNYEKRDNCVLSIMCCSPSKIKDYNALYRGKNYVPDVLSFVADEMMTMEGVFPVWDTSMATHDEHDIGDVLICMKQIEKQAYELQINFVEELARIVIHGVLHLLGYTHKGYEHTEFMLVRQEEILHAVMESCNI